MKLKDREKLLFFHVRGLENNAKYFKIRQRKRNHNKAQ